MSANGYITKLNKVKRSKAQNLSSSPQSFGMKMNNHHAVQKDKVSFGAPIWWEKFGEGAKKAASVVLLPQMYLGLGLVEAAFDKMANQDKYQKLKN